jgi:integrase/recombinase XerC
MSIPQFLQYLQYEKKYSLKTIQSYESDLEEFQVFFFSESDSTSISQAEKNHLRSYLMKLSQSDLAERSINRKISSLKSYYKYLLKIGEIETSPASALKTLKQYNKFQIPFSEDELAELFSKEGIFTSDFEGIRDRLMMEMFYQTGMRRIELIQLTDSDLDLVQKTIKVIGKRNKERMIPIGDELIQSICQYRELRDQEVPNVKSCFFKTILGKPMPEKLVYNLVNTYLSHISTKHKKSPHMLRHSFATHMLNRGAELNAIKELLGHSSLAATQVYTHGSIDQLKKVFNHAHPRERKN